MTKVLLLGSTGYFGGSVLALLQNTYPDLHIHALIRNPAQKEYVESAGANQVTINATGDRALLRSLVSESDVVINAADGLDLKLKDDLIEGLKTKRRKEGGIGALIHVGGTTAFIDGNKEGKWDPNARVWTDDESDIRQITTDVIHGAFDIPLLEASEAGDFNLFIFCPPAIYGDGAGPVARESQFCRMLLLLYQGGTKPIYTGEGTNKLAIANIQDLLSAFKLIFDAALKAGGQLLPGSAYSRYFIVTTSHIPMKTLATLFAREMHRKKIADSPEPTSVPYDENSFVAKVMASNMLATGTNAQKLGWKPTENSFNEEEFVKHIRTTFEAQQNR